MYPRSNAALPQGGFVLRIREIIEGYHDLVEWGRREIYKVEG